MIDIGRKRSSVNLAAEAAKAKPQNVQAELSRNFFSQSHKIFEPSRSSRKIFQFILLNCL